LLFAVNIYIEERVLEGRGAGGGCLSTSSFGLGVRNGSFALFDIHLWIDFIIKEHDFLFFSNKQTTETKKKKL
jgi:hypothetical protein